MRYCTDSLFGWNDRESIKLPLVKYYVACRVPSPGNRVSVFQLLFSRWDIHFSEMEDDTDQENTAQMNGNEFQ